MTAALEGVSGQQHAPAALYSRENPEPILQEAGWVPGQVWTGGKFRRHRDSIPDRPAGSQSLYRLSYRTHPLLICFFILSKVTQMVATNLARLVKKM